MEEPKQKADKLLSLNKLSQKSRQKLLFDAFINYPTGVGYADRLRDIAARSNTKPTLIFQHARRHDWQTALERVLDEQRKDEAFAQALDSTNPQREIPLSSFVSQVKGLSFLLLSTAQTVVRSAAYMIQYYAALIAREVSQAGGFSLLTPEQLTAVESYQGKLQHHAKTLEPYLKPGAVTALLSSINFSQQIPDDSGDRDGTAFTIAALAAKMRELGLPSAFEAGGPARAVADFTPAEGLPELGDPLYLASDSE